MRPLIVCFRPLCALLITHAKPDLRPICASLRYSNLLDLLGTWVAVERLADPFPDFLQVGDVELRVGDTGEVEVGAWEAMLAERSPTVVSLHQYGYHRWVQTPTGPGNLRA